MADDIDRAQRLNEQHLQQSLAARESASHLPSHFDCLDCEEPISEARRRAVPGCLCSRENRRGRCD